MRKIRQETRCGVEAAGGTWTPHPADAVVYAMVLEYQRPGRLDEGVITSVPDANIGSIMGIGFPPWTGGVVQFINGYPGGLPGFVARARELADRFTPPPSLIAKAERGESFE